MEILAALFCDVIQHGAAIGMAIVHAWNDGPHADVLPKGGNRDIQQLWRDGAVRGGETLPCIDRQSCQIIPLRRYPQLVIAAACRAAIAVEAALAGGKWREVGYVDHLHAIHRGRDETT